MKEERICICGCGKVFKCNINSHREYSQGHWSKGKTYEEIMGSEKAQTMKEKKSRFLKQKLKGIKYEERYGKRKAQEIKEKISNKNKGHNKERSYIEIYGLKKAEEIKEKKSKAMRGKFIGRENCFRGITFIERYGLERTQKIIEKQSKSMIGKNKGTLEEKFDKIKVQNIREKISKALKGRESKLKGKTFEEIMGVEKAKRKREKISKTHFRWTQEKIIEAYLNVEIIRKVDWNRLCGLKLLPCSGIIKKNFGSFENLEEISGKKFLPRRESNGRIGHKETPAIDQLEIERGRKYERQYKVITPEGEVFYLDGYNAEYNEAPEFDEIAHKYKKIPDQIRENKVKGVLGCTFIRIKEWKQPDSGQKDLGDFEIKFS